LAVNSPKTLGGSLHRYQEIRVVRFPALNLGPYRCDSARGFGADRPHSALGGRTPDEAYHAIEPTPLPGLAPATASIRLAA